MMTASPRPPRWDDDRVARMIMRVTLVCIIAAALVAALSGCSPRVYERVVYRTDTLRVVDHRLDSVFVRDSSSLTQRGDTVFIYREHIRDRWRVKTDTILRVVVDSVAVERVKEVQVSKPLSWWQTFKIRAFWGLVIAVALLLVWIFRKSIFNH